MVLKIGVSIIAFFTILCSIGCDSDGVFENPDSIMLTSFDAIQGRTGHVIGVNLSEVNEVTKKAVLEIWDKEVSDATLYVVIESADNGLSGLVDLFNMASEVTVVHDLPKETKPWTNLRLNLGGTGDAPFEGYLRVVTPIDTVYITLWGTLSQERKNRFLTAVRKPPEVIGGVQPPKEPPQPPIEPTPAEVLDITYYRDHNLTIPLFDEVLVGDTVYTKVVFSKDVPIVFAEDASARPSISSIAGSREFQYRMRPPGTPLQSGEAKPYQDTENVFICEYDVRTDDFDELFRTFAGHRATAGTALRVRFFVHTDEIPPDAGETIVNWQPQDFVGQVFTTRPHPSAATRSSAAPVPGVTVSIVSGPRSGERTVTDRNGRYRFLNVRGDRLHLRTERDHFEPKEAVVHRFGPTSLPDGTVPNYPGDPQRNPGNILIGQVWPDEVRPILKEVLLVHDLLYIEAGVGQENDPVGYYDSGIVFVFSNGRVNLRRFKIPGLPVWPLKTFEHEIAHAHQHAVVAIDGSRDVWNWKNSPEGRAYAEARQRDLDLGEKLYYDLPDSYYSKTLLENAAEHCANYWGHKRGAEPRYYWSSDQFGKTLEELAPNRFRWAEEWLKKK